MIKHLFEKSLDIERSFVLDYLTNKRSERRSGPLSHPSRKLYQEIRSGEGEEDVWLHYE